MLMVNNLVGFGAARTAKISFVDSAISTATTITMPSDIQAGDLLVLFDFARNTSGTPSDVVPTGWTGINTATGSIYRHRNSYKLADGTEGSSSVTGMAGSTLTNKVALVFRRTPAASILTLGDADIQMIAGDPTSDTILSGSGTAPLVALAGYAISANSGLITTETFSPTRDGERSNGDNLIGAYKIYNSAPANVTADMPDYGIVQTLSSFYMEMS